MPRHEVDPVALHFEDPVDRLRREQPDAIDLAAAGHRRLEGATERALPWPLAAPMSARRHSGVLQTDGSITGPTKNLKPGSSGSMLSRSNSMRRRRHHVGDAMELRGRQADVEVGAQRPRDLVGKELAQRWPVMRRITSPIRWP